MIDHLGSNRYRQQSAENSPDQGREGQFSTVRRNRDLGGLLPWGWTESLHLWIEVGGGRGRQNHELFIGKWVLFTEGRSGVNAG